VTSLNRPTRNLTGVTVFAGELLPKRLELLRELVGVAEIIAVIVNPNNPNLPTRLRDMQEAARKLGQQILILNASNDRDIDAAFATMAQQRSAAVWPVIATPGATPTALAAKAATTTIPVVRDWRKPARSLSE
jgi:putative tryptophan/tyrosine transport system substrate-binding protein